MAINSLKYVIFVAIVVVIYYLFPKRTKGIVLLIASYVFYFINSSKLTIYLIITTISIYCISLLMTKIDKLAKEKCKLLEKDSKKIIKKNAKIKKKLLLVVALVINFGILIALKYCNFIFLNINSICNVFNINFNIPFKNVVLPLGISYYTLQAVSYVVDVYRGKYKADKNFFRVALFVSFFPHIVEGPIGKYDLIADDIYNSHKFNYKNFTYSIQLILWGYFKKMVIADRAAIGLATIQSDVSVYYGAYAFVGMLLYAIDLYADFTGGIDITIGVAQMFGITLPENFRRPFFSKSIAEYWRRWHITLCAWFKDYLFYPLSMSKWMNKVSRWLKKHVGKPVGSRFPVYFSSLTVWFVTGIWHGASWNFVVWGLLNSIIMLVSQELKPLYEKADNRLGYRKLKYYKVFEIIRTTAIVCCLQMLDYYRDIAEAFRMFFSMFTSVNYAAVFTKGMWSIGLSAADYIVIFAGVVIMFAVSLLERKCPVRDRLAKKNYIIRYTVFLVIFLLIAVFGIYGTGYESSQFIYNQF